MSSIDGNAFLARANTAARVLKANEQRDLNEKINKSVVLMPQTEASERSKIARGTDYLAAIPLIGSLFGLARIVASVAVAAYYKWHEKSVTYSADMLLRAQDEAIRGLQELFPCGGLLLVLSQHDLEKTITPGAAGKFYCRQGKELYYGNTPLKDKNIQWIRQDQIPAHIRTYEKLTATFSLVGKYEDTVYVRDQGRVIENDADSNGPLLTTVQTRQLPGVIAPVKW